MNKYIKIAFIGASLCGLTACQDYLDEEPKSNILPENYFKDLSLVQAYVQDFYLWLPSHSDNSYGLGTFSSDNGTDNQAALKASSMWAPGTWLVPERASNWNFENIRKANFFFEQAQENFDNDVYNSNQSLAEQVMGEAHFFRAWAYWVRYKAIGDFPIVEKVYDNTQRDELVANSVRQPRNKVARYILDELTEAIKLLPEKSTKGKNGISKNAARLLRARVALFEATWLKHHKGTALVPGGPGWPGDAALLGTGFNIDDEIAYFLTEAMASAKVVGDEVVGKLATNTEAKEGQNTDYGSNNPYYTMFCDADLSAYDEVLLYRSYSVSENVTTQIQAQFQKNGGGSGWTRGLVNSFLMKNGLPVYDGNSGYNAAWENEGVSKTLTDRDSRIVIFTKGDDCVDTYSLSDKTPIIWREGWLLDGTSETRAVTGFAVKKGKGYNYAEAQGNNASFTGSIVFRATEAMLIYMEASYEKNGTVDGTADGYWKALRQRAHVDTDYSKTIAATVMAKEAEGDWGAYSHGALIDPTLYNIRRERRNELIGEALRMDDLRRWAALDQMITTPYIIEGIKYWGTCYADKTNPLCLKDDKGVFLAPIVDETSDKATMSAKVLSDYVRPYQITRTQNNVFDGYHFTRAHYLDPIGHDNFTRASTDGQMSGTVIYQNPGWGTNTGDAPTNLD